MDAMIILGYLNLGGGEIVLLLLIPILAIVGIIAIIRSIAKRSRNNKILEQLEKLSSLKEKGMLTEQEFAEQKRKLLS